MLHRLAGYTVLALVAAAGLAAWRATRSGPPLRHRLALAAPILALLQVGWGLLTVASYVDLAVVSLHLATGAALLATLLTLFLQLGPQGAAIPSTDDGLDGLPAAAH
jgi:heme A synthase